MSTPDASTCSAIKKLPNMGLVLVRDCPGPSGKHCAYAWNILSKQIVLFVLYLDGNINVTSYMVYSSGSMTIDIVRWWGEERLRRVTPRGLVTSALHRDNSIRQPCAYCSQNKMSAHPIRRKGRLNSMYSVKYSHNPSAQGLSHVMLIALWLVGFSLFIWIRNRAVKFEIRQINENPRRDSFWLLGFEHDQTTGPHSHMRQLVNASVRRIVAAHLFGRVFAYICRYTSRYCPRVIIGWFVIRIASARLHRRAAESRKALGRGISTCARSSVLPPASPFCPSICPSDHFFTSPPDQRESP